MVLRPTQNFHSEQAVVDNLQPDLTEAEFRELWDALGVIADAPAGTIWYSDPSIEELVQDWMRKEYELLERD